MTVQMINVEGSRVSRMELGVDGTGGDEVTDSRTI